MAEQNPLEFMTEQRDRLKAEVDTLAVRVDGLTKEKTDLAEHAIRLASDRSRLESELGAAKAREASVLAILQRIGKLLKNDAP